MKRFGGVAWLLAFSAACGVDLVAPEHLPEGFRAPALDTSSWERLERSTFSYAIPPGFVDTGGIPIDSDAVSHGRGEDSLGHDFGLYSGEWSSSPNEPISDVREVWTVLGGRRAQLVSYRLDGRYVVRAWWEGLSHASYGDLHLVVRGESATLATRDELLAAIHSVRFD
jgi:hypothetical protein